MAGNPGNQMQRYMLHDQDPMLDQCDTSCETIRQRFRRFQYTEAAGPRENFNQLWELCHQWLQPNVNSLEQILEMLVLEQFLTVLPSEIEDRVNAFSPENRETLFSLIEDIQRQQKSSELQIDKDDKLFEELMPPQMEPMLQDEHQEPPAPQVLEPIQEAPVMEVWMLEPGQQEHNYSAESQNLLEPGLIILLVENTAEENTKQIQGEENAVGEASEEHTIPESDFGACSNPGKELWMEKLPHSEPMDQSSVSERDRNAFKEFEQLEPPQEPRMEDLLSVSLETQGPQRSRAGEIPHSFNQAASLQLTSKEQKMSKEMPHCDSVGGQQLGSDTQVSCDMKTTSRQTGSMCSRCKEGYLYQLDLKKHQHVHTGDKHYQCSACNTIFIQISHPAVHHTEPNEKDAYKCPDCRKSFLRWSTLKEHLKIHSEEIFHECSKCGKIFNHLAPILHQSSPNREKKFVCEHCERKYKQKSHLKISFQSHTEDKPYKYSHSSRIVITKSNLTAQQTVHTQKSPEDIPKEVSPKASSSNS